MTPPLLPVPVAICRLLLPDQTGSRGWLLALLAWLGTVCGTAAGAADHQLFEIQVIDRATRRGVPLVELLTTHDVQYVTDNAGRVALDEPERHGETVFFFVKSPGYTLPADGFGISGVRLKIVPGQSAVIEVDRQNPAERLYRITGLDLYRDSLRLGYQAPLQRPLGSGMVAGQDSVQVAAYRGRLHWFWGDTNRLSYPLGLFRTAGATSPLPNSALLPASQGINLDYFTDAQGFARAMVDVPNSEGVVWIDGVCTVPDSAGRERLVAHFSRRRGLAEALEQGLLLYNDERDMFEVLTVLDLHDTWRFIRDHPVRITEDGIDYLAFGNPFPVTRVPAALESVRNPEAYESWTCLPETAQSDAVQPDAAPSQSARADQAVRPQRDADGRVVWAWRRQPPTTQQDEFRWLTAGLLQPEECRFVPVAVPAGQVADAIARPAAPRGQPLSSAASGSQLRPVQLHSGTVFYNSWRQKWIMIAVATASLKDSPSFLGEVWYAEAASPQGPFRHAVKIATHPRQTFYNPCQHPFLDEADGRVIYFEGTYCNTFTDSPATPRYNYNQLMYRLDLGQAWLPQVFHEH